jgi:glycine/D-amino acid oxidase-like deaminating enzyme
LSRFTAGLGKPAISAKEARELEPALSAELEAAAFRPDEASVDNRLLRNLCSKAKRVVEIHHGALQAIGKTVQNVAA